MFDDFDTCISCEEFYEEMFVYEEKRQELQEILQNDSRRIGTVFTF